MANNGRRFETLTFSGVEMNGFVNYSLSSVWLKMGLIRDDSTRRGSTLPTGDEGSF